MKKLLFVLGTLALLTVACAPPASKSEYLDWNAGSGEKIPDLIQKSQKIKVSEVSGLNTAGENQSFKIDQQTIGGIPVEDTFVKTYSGSDGKPTKIQAHLEKRKVSTVERIRWGMAIKNKEKTLQKLLQAHPELRTKKIDGLELKLSRETKELIPIWSFQFTEGNGEMWEITYSLHLAPLSVSRLGSDFDVTPAMVFPKGPKLSRLEQVWLPDLLKGDNILSKSLKVSSASDDVIQVSGAPLLFSINDGRFDQVQSFYIAQKTLNWFQKNFGVTVPHPMDLRVHVGAPEKTNTAFYYSGNVRLGAGDDLIYKNLTWDPSIVAHETSHYIIDLMAHLPFQKEGGSLNEGYADFFAAVILDNPKLGESSYLEGPFKRRIDLSKKYSEKSGGLYADSLIVSSLLWQIKEKFPEEKGIKLAFLTLENLNPQSDIADFGSEIFKQSKLRWNEGDVKKLQELMQELRWPTATFL